MKLRAVTDPAARVATGVIDRLPWTAVMVRGLRVAGLPYVVVAVALGMWGVRGATAASIASLLVAGIRFRVLAQARRLRDPALRRYRHRIVVARRRWATALGDAAAATAHSNLVTASHAQSTAAQADQEARRLSSSLLVSG